MEVIDDESGVTRGRFSHEFSRTGRGKREYGMPCHNVYFTYIYIFIWWWSLNDDENDGDTTWNINWADNRRMDR